MAEIVSVKLVVGMEVHVELACASKAFSRAASPAAVGASSDSEPNRLIDPVVLGLPGALPVLNRAAVEMSIRVGLALNCSIAPLTRWDRKNYFYADMPKGYQISQYDRPLCFDGALDVPAPLAAEKQKGGAVLADHGAARKRVGIIRAHLEEDAGKLLHDSPGGGRIDYSIVDLNRAGTALLEIVTQPDIGSAEEAVLFCQTLRDICKAVGASRGVMQKGHMRFEPNVNCHLTLSDGRLVKTPIVEVKNLNSFKSVRGAIEFERREQPERWRRDGREMGPGMKQTRGWDEAGSGGRGETYVMREKEDAHDYRYFPDPDLLPVAVSGSEVERLREQLPELPLARFARLTGELGLSEKEAEGLGAEPVDGLLFDRAVESCVRHGVSATRGAKACANLLLQSGLKRVNERAAARAADDTGGEGDEAGGVASLLITPGDVAAVAVMRERGELSAQGADELFGLLATWRLRADRFSNPGGLIVTGGDGVARETECAVPPALWGSPEGDVEEMALARKVAGEHGLLVVRDDAAIDGWVRAAIEANPQAAADVRAGKEAAAGRIVGAAAKLSAGTADPAELRRRIVEVLRGG